MPDETVEQTFGRCATSVDGTTATTCPPHGVEQPPALRAALADLAQAAARTMETTHWGPDPAHGGLTQHKGDRASCSGPDCGYASDQTEAVLAEVAGERIRQDEKWGRQDHLDGTGQWQETVDADVARMAADSAAEGGYLDWLHILRAEVAEALAETRPARLRDDLLQVAAVAVAWIEAIDRRSEPEPTDA